MGSAVLAVSAHLKDAHGRGSREGRRDEEENVNADSQGMAVSSSRTSRLSTPDMRHHPISKVPHISLISSSTYYPIRTHPSLSVCICSCFLSSLRVILKANGQLPILHPSSTLLPILSALLSSHIYTLDPLSLPTTPFSRRRHLKPLKTYRFPRSLLHLGTRALQPLFGGDAGESTADGAGGGVGNGSGQAGSGSGAGQRGGPRRGHRTIPGQVNSEQRGRMGVMARLWNGNGNGNGGTTGGGAATPARRAGASAGGGADSSGSGAIPIPGGLEAQAARRRLEEIQARLSAQLGAASQAGAATRTSVSASAGSAWPGERDQDGRRGSSGLSVPLDSPSGQSEGWSTVPNSATDIAADGLIPDSDRRDTGDSQETVRQGDADTTVGPSSPSSPVSPSASANAAHGRSASGAGSSRPAPSLERRVTASTAERAQAARSAIGAWVSEIAGGGVRAPTEHEIAEYVSSLVFLDLSIFHGPERSVTGEETDRCRSVLLTWQREDMLAVHFPLSMRFLARCWKRSGKRRLTARLVGMFPTTPRERIIQALRQRYVSPSDQHPSPDRMAGQCVVGRWETDMADRVATMIRPKLSKRYWRTTDKRLALLAVWTRGEVVVFLLLLMHAVNGSEWGPDDQA